MTARKQAAPKEAKAPESAPEPKTSTSTAVGGLAELQAQADVDTTRGFKGPEEES